MMRAVKSKPISRRKSALFTGRSGDWQRLLRRKGAHWLAWSEYHLRLSRFTTNRSNAIITYHSIGDPEKFGNVSPTRLRRDLEYLGGAFDIVDLPEVLAKPTVGRKCIAVTFDDGYKNFYTHALPVLRDLEVPVTVFVPSGFLDGRSSRYSYRFFRSPSESCSHNDPDAYRSTGQSADVMTAEQLRETATESLVTVGNHTHLHPDLSAIGHDVDLEAEIIGARNDLEDRLNTTIDRFSYPYGKHNDRVVRIARQSHDLAVTTRPGLLKSETDRYRLPRIGAHVPEASLRFELTDLRWRLTTR